MKKNSLKSMVNAISKGKDVTLEKVARGISFTEMKSIIKEEFEDMKSVEDIETEENEGGWGAAELAKEVDWVDALDLKEHVFIENKEEEKEDYEECDTDSEKTGEPEEFVQFGKMLPTSKNG